MLNTILPWIVRIPGVFIAIMVHEYAKVIVNHRISHDAATRPRPRSNPFKFVDILGFLIKLIFGYGWAMPVRLNPFGWRNRNMGMLLIFAMPFAVNIIVGSTAMILAQIIPGRLYMAGVGVLPASAIYWMLYHIGRFNFAFAIFNFIPIYPLNGNLLISALRPTWGLKITQYEKVLQIALAFLIILGFAGIIFDPIVNIFIRPF